MSVISAYVFNREVAEYLQPYLDALWWTDKVGGMVITARSGEKSFPIEFNAVPDTCETQFHDYVPDDTKASILYFEDRGFFVESFTSRHWSCRTQLRLVLWLNYKLLDADTYVPDAFVLDVLNALPVHFSSGNIIGATLTIESTTEEGIFDNYSYDIDKMFTFYPYGAAAIDLTVTYRVGRDCKILQPGTPDDCI